jgi:hypothetical protein
MTELEKAVDDLTKDFGLEVSGGDFTKEQYLKYSQAILALIQDEVRKGKIEEINSVFSDIDGELWYAHPRMATGNVANEITLDERLKQLSEGKE